VPSAWQSRLRTGQWEGGWAAPPSERLSIWRFHCFPAAEGTEAPREAVGLQAQIAGVHMIMVTGCTPTGAIRCTCEFACSIGMWGRPDVGLFQGAEAARSGASIVVEV
jgi:hypothetical protein